MTQASPTSVVMDDWDCLFVAVTQRLCLIAAPTDATTRRLREQETLEALRAGVLECVQALDQLHAMQIAPRASAQPKHEVFHEPSAQAMGAYPCNCLHINAS